MQISEFFTGTLKDMILKEISIEFSLTAKEIYYRLKKKNLSIATYQAVFKALQEMTLNRIIAKNYMKYTINNSWIAQFYAFAEQLRNTYLLNNQNAIRSIELTKVAINFDPRIINFVNNVGPKATKFLQTDEGCIYYLSNKGEPLGTGAGYFGMMLANALKDYLNSNGHNVLWKELSKPMLNIEKKDVQNKKIIVVDTSIYTGTTYKLVMEKLNSLKAKYHILDIRYAVEHDLVGLADWSCTSNNVSQINSAEEVYEIQPLQTMI